MEYTTLGRTGIRVSVMGLGCGGHSRLGLAQGKGAENAVAIVRRALELGVNFIDTAESYGTEEAVGKALAGVPRDSYVLGTKAGVSWQGQPCSASDLRARLEASLKRLRVDHVDVYHLHGVTVEEYAHATNELVPEMQRLRQAGLIRHPGITERFAADPGHAMLERALQDDWFDVVMVGFNVLNQSARDRVFAVTKPRGIATLCMFAVRKALSQPAELRSVIADLVARGMVDPAHLGSREPLDFLLEPGVASTVPEAAYRFCRHEPGLDVILSGTGAVAHLEENARSINAPPLPSGALARLRNAFARVDCVSGN